MIKKTLYIFSIIALLIPLANYLHPFINSKNLVGFYEVKEKPKISLKSIYSYEFQTDYEKHIQRNIGLRSDFIRLKNQIYYSLFNVAYNPNMLVGEQGYFYEMNYIDNGILGQDICDDNILVDKTKKIYALQEELKKHNKELLIIFAPGKASYFPEYVPKIYMHKLKYETNYSKYIKLFNLYNVNYIDFKNWFIQLKKSNYPPLYTKTGVHWNKLGTYIVIDSLVNYFNKTHPQMPELVLADMNVESKYWYNESDCYDNLNLISHKKKEKLIHPEFYFKKREGQDNRLTSIAVADSYYWNLHLSGFSNEYFKDGQFWYYNDNVYYTDGREEIKTSDPRLNFEREIKNADVFIILFTDINQRVLDGGFIDKLYNLYITSKDNDF